MERGALSVRPSGPASGKMVGVAELAGRVSARAPDVQVWRMKGGKGERGSAAQTDLTSEGRDGRSM